MYIEAYNKQMQRDSEQELTTAYMAAYWQRVKKMPSLKDVLKKGNQRPAQSPEQMLAEVQKLNAALGGGTSG
ncbi:hypothetical protein [Paenibacillus typhae]|uniref:hypothetical protein n=1 Tax=Paenibacillus typhae TaxID=1174501 RepID=UPI001C8DFEE8|nr:hypothetical protein [Paenibacillus typhae]MBY0011501.1 hypothetical protein [Paenibacillus typhae]